MRVQGLLSFMLVAILLATAVPDAIAKKKSQVSDCDTDAYTCLRVKSGQSWESLFPDERERDIVMRINHRNGELWRGLVIKIPNNLEQADLLDFSPFPQQVEAPQEKLIVFDPVRHAWAAYDPNGSLVRWGPATGGQRYCADIGEPCRTQAGRFRIFSMGSSDCVSSKFPIPDGGAPMPYCMFFNGGQALHGSPGGVVKGNESHGCVRLFVSDAEWLRYEFVDQPDEYSGTRGTQVIVLPYSQQDYAQDVPRDYPLESDEE